MSLHYKNIKNLYGLFCFIAVLFIAIPSSAQDYFDTKITPQEQAVFAFFRASGDAPDYDFWIKSKSSFLSLGKKAREDYFVREMLRLGRGYGMYDLDTDVLEIKTNVVVRYIEAEEDKPARLSFRFFGLGSEDVPTFDYRFGSGYVYLIIDQLNYFSDLKLTPEQDKAVREKIPYLDDEFDAEVVVHVRASEADYDTPVIELNGTLKWPMLGKIAYIKCVVDSYYTQQTHTLWDYLAPWYEEQFRIKNMPKEEKYPHPYDLFK